MASRLKLLNYPAKSPQPRGRHHKNVRQYIMHHIATILFVGIGIASLVFSIAHEAYWWRRRHWIHARGVVKGCKESWHDGTRYFSEVQFEGTGGPKTFVSQYGSNRKPMIGSEVKIVINPCSDTAAEVSISHRILISLAFSLMGIIAIAVGLSVKPIKDGEQGVDGKPPEAHQPPR